MGVTGWRHGCAVGLLIVTQTAAALAVPDQAEPPEAEGAAQDATRIGIALVPTMAVADNCSRDTDVVMCEPGRAFLAFEGSLLVQLLPELALRPFLRFGFEGGARGSQGTTSSGMTGDSSHSSQFGAAGVGLRVLPFAPSSFWLGARAGLWGVRDVASVDAGGDSEEFESQAWAPSIGGDLGFDVRLDDHFGLSFMLSTDYVMLSNDGGLPEENGVDWFAGVWFGFGLGIFFDV